MELCRISLAGAVDMTVISESIYSLRSVTAVERILRRC